MNRPEALTGTGSGVPAPAPTSTPTGSGIAGSSAGGSADSASWGWVGSPIASGQMWNPPFDDGGISQIPQMPFPSLKP